MQQTVGIVEDDPDQRENYTDALKKRGYLVTCYGNREEALKSFRASLPDLIILDIILDDEVDGGFDLCRSLLSISPGLPVIFLTDRVDEIDRISGLRMGAWDYITKPVSLLFLAEKVAALLRIAASRERPVSNEGGKRHGDLEINQNTMQVSWKGSCMDLTLTEFRILAALVRRPGFVLTYDALMDATLQSIVTTNTVNTHILHLRRKFKAIDDGFDCILNEYAVGYRWNSNR
ncbi:MAG: response regulator [Mariprofundaceae bacterium]